MMSRALKDSRLDGTVGLSFGASGSRTRAPLSWMFARSVGIDGSFSCAYATSSTVNVKTHSNRARRAAQRCHSARVIPILSSVTFKPTLRYLTTPGTAHSLAQLGPLKKYYVDRRFATFSIFTIDGSGRHQGVHRGRVSGGEEVRIRHFCYWILSVRRC